MNLKSDIKQPLTLRVSIIDRCQLRCIYCMPQSGIKIAPYDHILSYEEITAFIRVIQSAYSLAKVHITGGDPLIRRNIVSFVEMIGELHIPDLAMTTNAQELQSLAPSLKKAGLNRVNISLDSLDPHTFSKISRGGRLEKTLAGIDAALEAGLQPVKLNTVIMRGVNEADITRILDFAIDKKIAVRFLELMPVGTAASLWKESFIPSQEIIDLLSSHYTLTAVPREPANSTNYFNVKDGSNREGTIGFISPHSEPFCRGCNRLRLSSDGNIVGCLALNNKARIRGLIDSPEDLLQKVELVMSSKRKNNDFNHPENMSSIGG